MPPRTRRNKRRRRPELTALRALALSIGPDPLRNEPDDVLAEVWEEHREGLVDQHRHGARPWAWWYFEPGVPEHLRGDRPQLSSVEQGARVREEGDVLEARRAAWLAEHHAR